MLAQHSVDPSVKKSLGHKHFQQEQDDLCGTSEYVRITAGQVFGEIVETEENLDFIMKMSSRLKPISVSSILTLPEWTWAQQPEQTRQTTDPLVRA